MVRADYSGNVKRGGVCIYFKESLSLDVPSNLDECLHCELSYKNKKCFIAIVFYIAHLANHEESLKIFLVNLRF